MKKIIIISTIMALTLNMFAQGQRDELTNTIYATIKANEKNFPRPKPLDTLIIGQFKYSDQSFEGITSSVISTTGQLGKPLQIRVPGQVESKAAGSVLKFSSDQTSTIFTVIINNQRYSGNPVYIKVGAQEIVDWNIEQGPKKYKDQLKVKRLIIGMGAYTLPFIPIAILYAPPVMNTPGNLCTYTTMNAVGTSLTLGSANEVSETKPIMTGINLFNKLIELGISATKDNPDPHVQAAHQVLGLIRPAFGDKDITETVGSIRNNEVTISLNNISTEVLSTPIPDGGPGHSDKFILLVHPRILWFVKNGVINYTILDYEAVDRPTIDQMKASNDPFLLSLARLDPFFNTNMGKPQPPRFTPYGETSIYNLRPTDLLNRSLEKDRISSNRISNTSFTTEITDYTGGYMSFLGLGYDTRTVKQTFTQSSLYQVSSSTAQVSAVLATNSTNRAVTVQLFYDNAFGGLVVYEYPEYQLSPTSDAVLQDANGAPIPNKTVKLRIGTTIYSTTTDKTGHYKFFVDKNQVPAKGILIVDNKEKEISLFSKGGATQKATLSLKQ